jgi:hypothetical protein
MILAKIEQLSKNKKFRSDLRKSLSVSVQPSKAAILLTFLHFLPIAENKRKKIRSVSPWLNTPDLFVHQILLQLLFDQSA